MALGDAVSGLQSLAQYTYLNIQPPVGEEWIIHNLYFTGQVEVYFYDGTNQIKFKWFSDWGSWPWTCFHVTNTRYLRVYTIDSGTTLVGYDGVKSK